MVPHSEVESLFDLAVSWQKCQIARIRARKLAKRLNAGPQAEVVQTPSEPQGEIIAARRWYLDSGSFFDIVQKESLSPQELRRIRDAGQDFHMSTASGRTQSREVMKRYIDHLGFVLLFYLWGKCEWKWVMVFVGIHEKHQV